MFQRILVPLDGSSRAEQALPIAGRIAQASNGVLVLLRVASFPIDVISYPAGETGATSSIAEDVFEEAKAYLNTVKSVSYLSGIHVEKEVALGHAAQRILSVVETNAIDLVVMCSHGRTGAKRWLIGSVAEKVAHHTPVPVLILRKGSFAPPDSTSHSFDPLRVLVPLDGSAQAKAAIVPAGQLTAALSAPGRGSLHLTRVVALPTIDQERSGEPEASVQKTKRYLRSTVEHIREGLVASSLADLNLSITWSVCTDDDIAAGIIRVAENGEDAEGAGVFGRCQMIAMATHGRGAYQRLAMDSITERVLHGTSLPLLIVRPPLPMKDALLHQKKASAASYRLD